MLDAAPQTKTINRKIRKHTSYIKTRPFLKLYNTLTDLLREASAHLLAYSSQDRKDPFELGDTIPSMDQKLHTAPPESNSYTWHTLISLKKRNHYHSTAKDECNQPKTFPICRQFEHTSCNRPAKMKNNKDLEVIQLYNLCSSLSSSFPDENAPP